MSNQVKIYRLSEDFYKKYPGQLYPEILSKQERPYTCLCLDVCDEYYICIPFRTEMKHKNGFKFHNTERSKRSCSGLDYSKIIIVLKSNTNYFEKNIVVDRDEYIMVMENISTITREVDEYITKYIKYMNGMITMGKRQFQNAYGFATLPYFHEELGISL